MPCFFFERRKTERGEWPNVFAKDKFPQNVRAQCWQLCENAGFHNADSVVQQLRHTVGVYELNDAGRYRGALNELNYFYHNGMAECSDLENVEFALSVLELMCQSLPKYNSNIEVIENINHRLRLGGVGYKFADNQLIPVDDEDLANNAVIPAVSLLNRPEFENSYGYLHQAFLDYKEGTPESLQTAIDNCVKAAEAILKTIFDSIGIEYGPKDTYMPLVQKAAQNGLFPDISQDKLAPLTNQLKGIGEIRNKESGHGGDKQVSDKLVRLAINHTTSNLLYIAESYLERKE